MNKATTMSQPRELLRQVRVASSNVRFLAALSERLKGRTLDEVRRWVLNTNKPTRVPPP